MPHPFSRGLLASGVAGLLLATACQPQTTTENASATNSATMPTDSAQTSAPTATPFGKTKDGLAAELFTCKTPTA